MTRELSLYRSISLVLTGILFVIIILSSNLLWRSFFAALLYAHYLLSFKYSFKQLQKVLSYNRGKLFIILTVLASLFIHFNLKVFIIFYFALHFSLSEIYLKEYLESSKVDTFPKESFLYYISLYLWAFLPSIYSQAHVHIISEEYALVVIGVVLLISAFFHFKKNLKENLGADILFILFATISFFLKVSFEVGIFYHLILWIVLPYSKYKGSERSKAFIKENIYVTLFFLLISPLCIYGLSKFPYLDDTYGYFDTFRNTAYFWGYIHITLSFVLSDLNPPWLTSLMRKYRII